MEGESDVEGEGDVWKDEGDVWKDEGDVWMLRVMCAGECFSVCMGVMSLSVTCAN